MTEPTTAKHEDEDEAEGAAHQATHGDTGHDNPAHDSGGHAHPTELEYIKVAIVLALITLAEVLVYYVEALEDYLVAILLVFSGIKFVLVILWFMHLRFDSRLFRRLFFTGLGLALFCYIVVLSTFHVWTE